MQDKLLKSFDANDGDRCLQLLGPGTVQFSLAGMSEVTRDCVTGTHTVTVQ